jgi:Protein of unknown function (DUF3667)
MDQTSSRFHRLTLNKTVAPCRDCGVEFAGNFCPNCGQEAITGAPQAWEMIYEFLTRNVFERGKLWRTLWTLVRYPGALTVAFLEGRRQSYIRPVRLYFSLSLVYFFLIFLQLDKLELELRTKFAEGMTWGAAKTEQALDKPGTPTPQLSERERKDQVFSSLLNGLKQHLPEGRLRQHAQQFLELSSEERVVRLTRGMVLQTPKIMFLLLPVFALWLQLLFYRRKIPYGAHLLMSLHQHCLLFLVSLVGLAFPQDIGDFVSLLAWVLLLPALRRVYECGWWSAFWRWLVLTLLYLAVLYPAMLLTAVFVVVM